MENLSKEWFPVPSLQERNHFLVGISAPKKNIYPPPPRFPADTLPAPRPQPPLVGDTPPLLGFLRKKPTPSLPGNTDSAFPSPKERKLKISETSTKTWKGSFREGPLSTESLLEALNLQSLWAHTLAPKSVQNDFWGTFRLLWLSGPTLRPPYRAMGYRYTHRIYVLQGIAGYRAAPPPKFGGYRTIMLMFWKHAGGGGVSQVKAALSAIGRYRRVSQLYGCKSRFYGPLSLLVGCRPNGSYCNTCF